MPTTMIFVPGNNPAMVQNAGLFGINAVIFDLEDAVSPKEKDAARILIRNALIDIDYGNCDRTVRINSVDHPEWKEDIKEVIKGNPNSIVLPKAQRVETIEIVERALEELEDGRNKIEIIPLIETAEGVERVFNILSCSSRIKTVIFGAEDYTADIGVRRPRKGFEILYARCRIVNAAVATGVEPIDTPFTNVDDIEGLKEDTILAKSLGFKGKALISPRHCKTVSDVFAPSDEEIEYAHRILNAIKEAGEVGKGVIALDGKMIDAPIVARARKVLKLV